MCSGREAAICSEACQCYVCRPTGNICLQLSWFLRNKVLLRLMNAVPEYPTSQSPLRYIGELQVSKQKPNWTLAWDVTWTGFLPPELPFKALLGVLWYVGRKNKVNSMASRPATLRAALLGTSLTDWPDSPRAGSVSGVNDGDNQHLTLTLLAPHYLKYGHLSRKSVIGAHLKLPRPALILASLSLKSFSLQAVQLRFSKVRQHIELQPVKTVFICYFQLLSLINNGFYSWICKQDYQGPALPYPYSQ